MFQTHYIPFFKHFLYIFFRAEKTPACTLSSTILSASTAFRSPLFLSQASSAEQEVCAQGSWYIYLPQSSLTVLLRCINFELNQIADFNNISTRLPLPSTGHLATTTFCASLTSERHIADFGANDIDQSPHPHFYDSRFCFTDFIPRLSSVPHLLPSSTLQTWTIYCRPRSSNRHSPTEILYFARKAFATKASL